MMVDKNSEAMKREHVEDCSTQRGPVPKSEHGQPSVREGAAKKAADKQYGEAGWN